MKFHLLKFTTIVTVIKYFFMNKKKRELELNLNQYYVNCNCQQNNLLTAGPHCHKVPC